MPHALINGCLLCGKIKLNAVKNSYIYVAQMVITTVLPLAVIPVITRILPPLEYGIYILAQVYSMFAVSLVAMGMISGYERNYFQYKDDPAKIGTLLYTVLIFSLVFYLLSGIFVYLWKDTLARIIFEKEGYGMLLVIVFIGLGLQTLSQYYLTYLKNKGSAGSYSRITITQSLVNFFFIIIFLVYLGYGVISLAYALLLSNLTTFLFIITQQLRSFKISFSKVMLVGILKISLPLTPRILFGALNTQFDKMMLGMLSSMGGVGVYGIGHRISYVVFQFMTALDHVFIPELYNRLFSQGKNDDIDNIGKYLIPFFYISIMAAMGVALFSEELFIILLPKSYHDGINIVIILTIFYASMFFGKISGPQLIYKKKTHIISLLTLISVLVNILLNIPMIILWGTIGAAIATMLAGIISVIISYKVAQRYIPIKYEWNMMLRIIAIFIAAVSWAILTRVFLLEEYWIRLIGKIILVILFVWTGIKYKIINTEIIRKTLFIR